MKSVKGIGFIISILAIFLLAACGSSDDASGDGAEDNDSEAVDHTIIGIEPGAGISVTTEKAIEEYDNLKGWDVELSSTGAMMSELGTAIQNEEPIIITGWNPHWMFAQYPDMKYLEDPQGIYGGEETLNSLARIGFEEDNPDAYKFIDQFEWEVEDMEEIMYEAEETGEDIEDISAQWVEDNQDRVDAWAEGVNDGNGAEIKLASTPWDSERASSGVLKAAMEQHGFQVTVTDVDVAVVFESVASGDADATLAAWLPVTHKDFYEKQKDNLIDLGPNLEGAKIGLVVPEYMDIDSIEDLEPK
ncbi:glycine betaine ABC transporter substrate-binding protein [Oceanobacillus sp. FSL K6-3682]|uniref:glycine betaine ABC transporter substrate-binding protein n=1 Tax=Oceanobacillus sp. FSL K6-3682 TaxID=2921503 RepID=UPI0030DBB69D